MRSPGTWEANNIFSDKMMMELTTYDLDMKMRKGYFNAGHEMRKRTGQEDVNLGSTKQVRTGVLQDVCHKTSSDNLGQTQHLISLAVLYV